jgi:FkbM family methyltransferase
VVVNTQRVFAKLLRVLSITTVCDVGSLNGADALAFRAAAPCSSVYAFEPNPRNFALMQADPRLRQGVIELLPWAVSDHNGEAEFFLVEADYAQRDPRRGMSSLYSRSGEWAPHARLRVPTTRLDSFLGPRCAAGTRLALWIDAEGAAYEVLEGLGSAVAHLRLLHVEVETEPCIGAQQKLYTQVRALLGKLGFSELATDQPRRQVQFNALFVCGRLTPRERLAVRAVLLVARLRYLLVRTLARLCPACLRRYRTWRLRRLP